jgi:hypothetical protein
MLEAALLSKKLSSNLFNFALNILYCVCDNFVILFYFGSRSKYGTGTGSEMHSESSSAKAKISESDWIRIHNTASQDVSFL